MKAFFLLVLLFMVFFFIGASSFARVDLTPDTPPALVEQDIQTEFVPQPQVIRIEEAAVPQTQQIPVTGTCTDPYVVQSGDSLSRIAQLCGTTIGEIRLANPQITNINLIYPGQTLDIPGGTAGQPQVPVTGIDDKMYFDGLEYDYPSEAPSSNTVPVPVTGDVGTIRPGTTMEVRAVNYPPNTPVSIGIMPENGLVTVLAYGITDSNGSLTTTIALPVVQTSQVWQVVIVSNNSDGTQRIVPVSDPFYIAETR